MKNVEKKYKMVERKDVDNLTSYYRVQALKDFGNVKAGDIGGWIQCEDNLSHEGSCWVYDDSKVSGRAHIMGNAQVKGCSEICDDAVVDGNAIITNSTVRDNANVAGNARVYHNSRVMSSAIVGGAAMVGHSDIKTTAFVNGNAFIYDSEVYGNAHISGNAKVLNYTVVSGYSRIDGNAVVKDARIYASTDYCKITDNVYIERATIDGHVQITDDAVITTRGKIEGKTVISGNSAVMGECNVTDSTISHGSVIEDHADVKNSIISDSHIRNSAIVKGCTVTISNIFENATVEKSTIAQSRIYGNIKIAGRFHIEMSDISGNTILRNSLTTDDTEELISNQVICKKDKPKMQISYANLGRTTIGAYSVEDAQKIVEIIRGIIGRVHINMNLSAGIQLYKKWPSGKKDDDPSLLLEYQVISDDVRIFKIACYMHKVWIFVDRNLNVLDTATISLCYTVAGFTNKLLEIVTTYDLVTENE